MIIYFNAPPPVNHKSAHAACFKSKGLKNNCVGLLELHFSSSLAFADFAVEERPETIPRKDENKLFLKRSIRSILKKKST